VVLGVLGVVVLVAVGLAAVVVFRDRTTRTTATGGGRACTELRVLTAASYAPAIAAVEPRLRTGADCVQTLVTVADGRAAADRVKATKADVWIPDDTAWAADASDYLADPKATDETVLASSPVVFVGTSATMKRLRDTGGGWAGLARLVAGADPVGLTVRDPAGSGDGLLAVGGLSEIVWSNQGVDASASMLAAAFPLTRTVTGPAALPARDGEVGLVPEYALGGRQPAGLEVLVPSDRTALLRYTWLPTSTGSYDVEIVRARGRLLAQLSGDGLDRGDRARGAAHLRRPDGSSPGTASASPSASTVGAQRSLPEPFDVLAPHHVRHVFATWYPADRLADLLLVIDVSGSMANAVPGSATPLIDVVREGVLAVGRQLPDDARLGLWAFGSGLDPPRDYLEVLPLRRLDADQRAALDRSVGALAARRTGTGLNDTLLAAYQAAQKFARPGVPSQLMVFTDGRNEDDPGALPNAELAKALAAVDPTKPVGLTVVQLGGAKTGLEKALEPVHGHLTQVGNVDQITAAFMHLAVGGLAGDDAG
jgi:hypothetical protein